MISKLTVQHQRTEGHKIFPNAELQPPRKKATERALPTPTERETQDCSQESRQEMKIKNFKLPGINYHYKKGHP